MRLECVKTLANIFLFSINQMNTQYGNEQLQDNDKLAYDFSQQSYKKPDNRTNVGEYEYDPSLSNAYTAVWHNKTAKKTHVSNRGSTTAYDWLVSDAQIALGTEDRGRRFKRAVDTTKRAHEKYGYNVSTSGHSLGGKTSAYTTEMLGNEQWYDGGTGFNQGNSSLGRDAFWSKQRRECNSKNPPAYCNKQTNVKERGDYISNTNVACDFITFGLGGNLCRKSDAFGNTKTYDHRKSKRWMNALSLTPFRTPLRMFTNGKAHSLENFATK